MDKYQSLSHTQWEGLYHVVFIPKRQRSTLYKELRVHLGEVFRRLAEQKESRVEEGYLMRDHVHMMLRIPPKYSCRRWWGTSRGRVRSTLPGCTERGSAISWGSISGPVATLYRRAG